MSKTATEPQTAQRKTGEHVVLHANFEPTLTKDLGEGIIEAVVTTGALDHHNENILMDGVDVSAYHGTVLYGHDYEGLPIGKTISLTKMKNKIKAKFQLAVQEYPFANLVYQMIKGGYLSDVSIGGIVRRWSDDYQTIEEMVMKEFSVVPIGANQEAMITGVKALNISRKDLKREYKDFAKKVWLDKVSDMPHDELNDAIRTLKNLVATLEESAKANSAPEPASKELSRIKHITLRDSAKAVVTQSQRVITTIKLKRVEGKSDE